MISNPLPTSYPHFLYQQTKEKTRVPAISDYNKNQEDGTTYGKQKKNPRLTPATPNKQKIYLEPFYIYDDLFNYLVHYFFFARATGITIYTYTNTIQFCFCPIFFIFSFYDENN